MHPCIHAFIHHTARATPVQTQRTRDRDTNHQLKEKATTQHVQRYLQLCHSGGEGAHPVQQLLQLGLGNGHGATLLVLPVMATAAAGGGRGGWGWNRAVARVHLQVGCKRGQGLQGGGEWTGPDPCTQAWAWRGHAHDLRLGGHATQGLLLVLLPGARTRTRTHTSRTCTSCTCTRTCTRTVTCTHPQGSPGAALCPSRRA